MKALDRVVLVVAAASIVVLNAVVLASVAGPGFPNGFAMDFFGAVSEHKLATAAVAALMLLVVLYLVSAVLRGDEEPTPIVVNTALGDVRISMSAIEAIVRRAARQVTGIREVDAEATGDGKGFRCSLRSRYTRMSAFRMCANASRVNCRRCSLQWWAFRLSRCIPWSAAWRMSGASPGRNHRSRS